MGLASVTLCGGRVNYVISQQLNKGWGGGVGVGGGFLCIILIEQWYDYEVCKCKYLHISMLLGQDAALPEVPFKWANCVIEGIMW